MQRIHFILLQGLIAFHRGITFTLRPNEPFGHSISLNSAPPRVQTEADTCTAQTIIYPMPHPDLKPRQTRAQRRPLYKQCPTPSSNQGSGTRTAQAIL